MIALAEHPARAVGLGFAPLATASSIALTFS
jgi:hypothetical protein